jgi:hypothetical protein
MKWVQILLVVIVLELGVIAVKMPIGSAAAQARGAMPVCLSMGYGTCYGARDGSWTLPFFVTMR